MPRFALLEHDAPDGLHYDLLLQTGERLATWLLGEIPAPGRTVACRRLPDHREIYLDYEGPISGGFLKRSILNAPPSLEDGDAVPRFRWEVRSEVEGFDYGKLASP